MAEPPIREPGDIRRSCAEKLRQVEVSDHFTAILGCLLGEGWTTPRLVEMVIGPDGVLLGRCEGQPGFSAFLGAGEDLLRNVRGVGQVAGLDRGRNGVFAGPGGRDQATEVNVHAVRHAEVPHALPARQTDPARRPGVQETVGSGAAGRGRGAGTHPAEQPNPSTRPGPTGGTDWRAVTRRRASGAAAASSFSAPGPAAPSTPSDRPSG